MGVYNNVYLNDADRLAAIYGDELTQIGDRLRELDWTDEIKAHEEAVKRLQFVNRLLESVDAFLNLSKVRDLWEAIEKQDSCDGHYLFRALMQKYAARPRPVPAPPQDGSTAEHRLDPDFKNFKDDVVLAAEMSSHFFKALVERFPARPGWVWTLNAGGVVNQFRVEDV